MGLEDLYKFGKLEKHKTTPEEIEGLFEVAERCIKDASQDKNKIEEKLAGLPKGGVKERRISGKKYYYLQNRIGKKIVHKYLGRKMLLI